MSPLVVGLSASMLEIYPIVHQVALYLVPLICLFIGQGTATIVAAHRTTGGLVIAILLLAPVLNVLAAAWAATEREELRSVPEQVDAAAPADETMVVYYGAEPAFRHYVRRGTIRSHPAPILGSFSDRRDWQFGAVAQLAELLQSTARCWLVFAHVHDASGVDEQDSLMRVITRPGRILRCVTAPGASAFRVEVQRGG